MIRARLAQRMMNGTEHAYAGCLSTRKSIGEIKEFWFQAITLRLGDDCRYTPDFAVLMADDTMELHEVKGFMRDDAQVKIKAAAAQYPFVFRLVTKRTKKEGGGFEVKEIAP